MSSFAHWKDICFKNRFKFAKQHILAMKKRNQVQAKNGLDMLEQRLTALQKKTKLEERLMMQLDVEIEIDAR